MKLTKKDVAVVALANLGGAGQVIDTEDAAIAAHAIDPGAFGWRKYNDRVDLDMARTTLRHEGEAKQPRIEGSIQNGWHLTPQGVAWIEANAHSLAGPRTLVASTPAATQRRRAETREAGAAVNRIRTSDAYRLWSQGKTITARQAAEVFRIDEYTPAKDRSRKAAQLQELSRGDDDVASFLEIAIPAAIGLKPPSGGQKETNK